MELALRLATPSGLVVDQLRPQALTTERARQPADELGPVLEVVRPPAAARRADREQLLDGRDALRVRLDHRRAVVGRDDPGDRLDLARVRQPAAELRDDHGALPGFAGDPMPDGPPTGIGRPGGPARVLECGASSLYSILWGVTRT